jgi:hypothetical protein
MVRLLSEYTGRGPTKTRTYINEDLVSIVLQDTLTKGEQSLVRGGNLELVLASRKAYQNTMQADLVWSSSRSSRAGRFSHSSARTISNLTLPSSPSCWPRALARDSRRNWARARRR